MNTQHEDTKGIVQCRTVAALLVDVAAHGVNSIGVEALTASPMPLPLKSRA